MKEDILPPLPVSPTSSNSTHSPTTTTNSALVRRHHTLSTSSGLNVSERREARTALLSTGLSAADIDYYVPTSPIDPVVAWSDNGHGGISNSSSSSLSASTNIPTKANNSHRHIRGVSMGGSSTSSNSIFDESLENYHPSSSSSSTTQLSTSSPTFHSTNLPSSPPPASTSRRSSFVVLRGARGDAALTERRSVSDRRLSSGASSTGGHRNSLTSFLETDAEGLGQDEDWEQGINNERDREQEESMMSSTLSSPPPSTNNSTFRLPARASTLSHTRSISSVTQSDAWHSKEVSSVLRRPQSLNFRPSPASRASNSDTWRSHDRGVSEGYAMSSTVASPQPPPPPPPPMSNSSSYSSSRSPIPFSEPTAPHNSNPSGLTHSHSYSSQHSNPARHNSNPSSSNNNNMNINTGAAGLTHSNSFGSHHSHHSISNTSAGIVPGTSSGGPLSPVGGFGRSPWSPTREETQGMVSRAGISGSSPPRNGGGGYLNRQGSSSSGESGRQYLDAEDKNYDHDDDDGEEERNGRQVDNEGERIDGVDLGKIKEANNNSRNSRSILSKSTNDINRTSSPSSPSPSRRLPPLVTTAEILAPKKTTFRNRQGPVSASPFVPPIGHSHLQALSSPANYIARHPSTHPSFHQSYTSSTNKSYTNNKSDRKIKTAAPGTGSSSEWARQKELLVGGSSSNGNDWPPSGGFGVGLAIQQQQQIQVLQNQMMQAMEAMENLKLAGIGGLGTGVIGSAGVGGGYGGGGAGGAGGNFNLGINFGGNLLAANGGGGGEGGEMEVEESPVDIPTLIREKGYNPILFDLKPANARFFVIKSYTEEDVHKSLKHEIWASTDLGNKRLDKAFKENDSKGPIYLFFSVNGSGHFAGVARMLSSVDYTTSSTVWASDKWKGIFKVQWIYIKDVPLASLRHIRLSNTPENKPVTSSRDTQEVPYEAGCEVLRILSTYLARTSLLQDFAWYEARKDEPSTNTTTNDTTVSATTSTTATPSTVTQSLPSQQSSHSHYNNQHRSSLIPFPAPQGNFLQQPFQLYPPANSQHYYTNLSNSSSGINHTNTINNNSTSNLNYQQQQHQAHFVPPPFSQTQLLPHNTTTQLQQQQALQLQQLQLQSQALMLPMTIPMNGMQMMNNNPFGIYNPILIQQQQQQQLQQQQMIYQQQQYYNQNNNNNNRRKSNQVNNNNKSKVGAVSGAGSSSTTTSQS